MSSCELIYVCKSNFVVISSLLISMSSCELIYVCKSAFCSACAGPTKELFKADVIAVNRVTCLVLMHKHGSLISTDSIWPHASKQDDLALIERILQLESFDVDLFCGITKNLESRNGNISGGQLVGQSLAAASKSVDPKLLVHSLHSYFLRAGDPKLPIYYQIERVRDGHTFSTRRVIARQKGQQIFILNASFQKSDQDGLEHQLSMPIAPNPDQLLSWDADLDKLSVDPRIHPNRRRLLANKLVRLPLDIRLCNPVDEVHPKSMEPRDKFWVRARGKLSDDQGLHRCVAAYASDLDFLVVGLRPHAVLPGVHAIALSLDHSLWFHKSFRADEWLLFTIESPRANNARGLVFGHFYTQSGELVVSAAQEGVFKKLNAQKMNSKL
ncbi:hypothetical protein O6H91_14G048000 [Diphasiastrum complanatum]|uniref:Uncharacterized protein n=1 Tax=Diphasiastrum complanatum TaxID=34168 RepID=A0ACC2BP30_DIPCM|nr:hypothetical protein O6H91_14G048000 [Diphasiastrum complanatum]